MSEDEDEGGYEQSQPNGTLRHGHGDQEDDAEGEPDEEEVEGGDEEVEGSTRSRKRARANTVGDSVPLQSQAEPKEERRVTLPRDTDG